MPIRPTHDWILRGTVAVLLAATGACVTADDTPDDSDGVTAAPLNGATTFVGCTNGEQTKLTTAMQIIVGTMASSSFRACMQDSWMVERHEYLVEDMITRLQAMPTTIYCPVTDCGGDALACSGVGSSTGGPQPESMSVLKSTIANYSAVALAGIIAHEAAHSQGWNHPPTTTAWTYPFSVPEQVNACIAAGDGNGFSRADTRFDTELPKIGGEAGQIYGVWCPTGAHATGIIAYSDTASIRGFRLQCSDGSTSGLNGGTGPTTVTWTCPAGQSLAGFNGRSNALVASMSAGCVADADLLAGVASPRWSWSWLGGATGGGTSVERLCPAGKAVVGALGRSGSALGSVRWICRDLDAPAIAPPYGAGRVGNTDPNMVGSDELCSGGGALIGLMGSASGAVDRLSGMCLPRAPGLGPSGEAMLETDTPLARHALEWSGGLGGAGFELLCPVRNAIVGIRVRGDARVEAIGAVCAPTASWSLGSTANTTNLPLQGGPGGTYSVLTCPVNEFVVGLESYAGSTPEFPGSPITIHAITPICRRLK